MMPAPHVDIQVDFSKRMAVRSLLIKVKASKMLTELECVIDKIPYETVGVAKPLAMRVK